MGGLQQLLPLRLRNGRIICGEAQSDQPVIAAAVCGFGHQLHAVTGGQGLGVAVGQLALGLQPPIQILQLGHP